jgi:hypothetical protein
MELGSRLDSRSALALRASFVVSLARLAGMMPKGMAAKGIALKERSYNNVRRYIHIDGMPMPLHLICAQGMSKRDHTTHHDRQASTAIRKCRANFQARLGMSRARMAIAAMVFKHPGNTR